MIPLVYVSPKIADQIAARLNASHPGKYAVTKTLQGFKVHAIADPDGMAWVAEVAAGGHVGGMVGGKNSAAHNIAVIGAGGPVVIGVDLGKDAGKSVKFIMPEPTPVVAKPNDPFAGKKFALHDLPLGTPQHVWLDFDLVSEGKQYLTVKDGAGKKFIISKNPIKGYATTATGVRIVMPIAYAVKKGIYG